MSDLLLPGLSICLRILLRGTLALREVGAWFPSEALPGVAALEASHHLTAPCPGDKV